VHLYQKRVVGKGEKAEAAAASRDQGFSDEMAEVEYGEGTGPQDYHLEALRF